MKYATIKTFVIENNLENEGLNQVELGELYSLVQEIKSKNFQYSSDLSRYISKNKLGYDYPHISGIVTMKNIGRSWEFKGGFPSNIYRIVCTILDLRSNGSFARAVGFKSYASLNY